MLAPQAHWANPTTILLLLLRLRLRLRLLLHLCRTCVHVHVEARARHRELRMRMRTSAPNLLRNSVDGAEASCDDVESVRMCLPPEPYLKPRGFSAAQSSSHTSKSLPLSE